MAVRVSPGLGWRGVRVMRSMFREPMIWMVLGDIVVKVSVSGHVSGPVKEVQ